SRVVFPAPLGPMSATISPSRTSSDTPHSASRSPKCATTAWTSSMGRRHARRDPIMRGSQIRVNHSWVAGHLAGRPVGDLLAGVQHHDAIGNAENSLDQVL